MVEFDAKPIKELERVSWVGTRQWKQHRHELRRQSMLVYFRAEFAGVAGSRCALLLSASNRYKLWVNGARVCEGPCKGDRFRQFYDTAEIGPYLRDGANAIALEVLWFSPSLYGDGDKQGPLSVVSNNLGPMLSLAGEALSPEGATVDLSTGSFPWQYCIDGAVTPAVQHIGSFMPTGAMEDVELGRLPQGWKEPGFGGQGWENAVEFYPASWAGWGEFSPLPPRLRPIPALRHTLRAFRRVMKSSVPGLQPGQTVEIPSGDSFFAEYDAGELFTAYPQFCLSGGRGGCVRVTYAECYTGPVQTQYRTKGRRDDCETLELFGVSDALRPAGGEAAWEPFWWRTFRFVRVEAQAGAEPMTIAPPAFTETTYPMAEATSVSSRSCPWVAPLWDISVRTLKNCMHETHEDCPYYEQMQYALDTRLEILFSWALGGDARMAAKTIEDFHCTLTPEGLLYSRAPTDEPNIVPVFSLYWVFMLEDYCFQTGDYAFADRFRPTLDAVLAWFDRRIGSRGLVEQLYYWEFLDWAEDWKDESGTITAVPDSAKHGPTAACNLVYSVALDSAARLVARTRPALAQEYAARAQSIRENAEKAFWDEERGLFREGVGRPEYTQHAQAFAVLSGLASGARADRILRNALSEPDVVGCTYVFSFFLFRALEHAGLYALTEGLWEKWKEAVGRNVTTWPEDLKRQRSDCHAWGSLPLYEFTRCFCGVRALEPGYRKLLIRPVCTYLADMSGEVSTPVGPVSVEWKIEGGEMDLRGTSPEGVPVELCSPSGSEKLLHPGGAFHVRFRV